MKSWETSRGLIFNNTTEVYHIHEGDNHIADCYEGEKYANLIAAAPELLTACVAALDEAPWVPLGEDVRTLLRNAIAKAKEGTEEGENR